MAYVDPGGYGFTPGSPPPTEDLSLAYWQKLFANDPLYQQQVTSEYGQIPGDTASYAGGALSDATRSGLLGVKDASGNRPFLDQLRAAFTKRGIKDPFSALSNQNALNEASVASEALNASEITPWAQGQRRLRDLTRTDTNDLAARGILRSGENAYRAGNRQLLGEQTKYNVLQDVLDRIEGRNAGLLAAQRQHQQNLWAAANAAAGRFQAQEAAAAAAKAAKEAADEAARRAAEEAARRPDWEALARGRRDVTKGSGDPTQGEPVWKPEGVAPQAGPWPDAPGSNTGEFNPDPFKVVPSYSSPVYATPAYQSIGPVLGGYQPPKKRPKVSGAFATPAYRSLGRALGGF